MLPPSKQHRLPRTPVSEGQRLRGQVKSLMPYGFGGKGVHGLIKPALASAGMALQLPGATWPSRACKVTRSISAYARPSQSIERLTVLAKHIPRGHLDYTKKQLQLRFQVAFRERSGRNMISQASSTDSGVKTDQPSVGGLVEEGPTKKREPGKQIEASSPVGPSCARRLLLSAGWGMT